MKSGSHTSSPYLYLKGSVAGAVAGIRTHVAAIAWVSRPALNPPRHKSTPAARQTESDPAPTTLFPLFNFWVVPVRLGPPPLPALTPDRSPPRPPILARLDPHTPHAWSALALNRGPPWPTILARLDLLWASTQKFQAGIVQYNQFAVDAGTSDTKCRRSRRWDSNPRRCDSLSQPSSTQSTAPQEYSGGEADRVWPGAYHSSVDAFLKQLEFNTRQASVCWEQAFITGHTCNLTHPISAHTCNLTHPISAHTYCILKPAITRGMSPWQPLLETLHWYPIIQVKSLLLLWSSGTSIFHLLMLKLHMVFSYLN